MISSLSPTARRLLAARFWRSIAQGTLVVDLALYLHALGWSGTAIGAVLSGGGLVGAALSLMVGVTSDRLRPKPFLLTYEGLSCVCALTVLFTTKAILLGSVIILAGFGRGANGAAGPFAPAEQAWLAEVVDAAQRGFVYSLNTALGFFGMALGAMAAALLAGGLTRRAGLVRVVVWGRTGSFLTLLLLPLMPLYWLAAMLYVFRSALNRGTIGARQALVISAVRDERRGLAASLNALSVQLPQSIGPAIAGSLIGSGRLILPFYLAAVLQGLYIFLYSRVFGPREQEIINRATENDARKFG